jgi:hypothetical protein
MKIITAIIFTLLLSSCGLDVEHKGTVEVEVKVSLDQISNYFEIVCEENNPNATRAEIVECVADSINDFITKTGI